MISLADAQPGDIVAFETPGTFGRLIQLGQFLRRADRAFRKFHHIAVLVERIPNGTDEAANWTAVQAARHVDVAYLDDIAGGRPFAVLRCPDGVDRAKVVAQARALVGAEYGVLTVLSIALTLLTPRFVRLDFRAGGDPNLICSALGAICLHAGGWLHPWVDLYQVMPAELTSALSDSRLK